MTREKKSWGEWRCKLNGNRNPTHQQAFLELSKCDWSNINCAVRKFCQSVIYHQNRDWGVEWVSLTMRINIAHTLSPWQIPHSPKFLPWASDNKPASVSHWQSMLMPPNKEDVEFGNVEDALTSVKCCKSTLELFWKFWWATLPKELPKHCCFNHIATFCC